MPRPPKTPGEPVTDVIQTRVTPKVSEQIERARGKVSRSDFLRAAVEDRVTRILGLDQPQAPEVPNHRHRRGKLLSENTVKGVTTKIYQCAEEGCIKELSS